MQTSPTFSHFSEFWMPIVMYKYDVVEVIYKDIKYQLLLNKVI